MQRRCRDYAGSGSKQHRTTLVAVVVAGNDSKARRRRHFNSLPARRFRSPGDSSGDQPSCLGVPSRAGSGQPDCPGQIGRHEAFARPIGPAEFTAQPPRGAPSNRAHQQPHPPQGAGFSPRRCSRAPWLLSSVNPGPVLPGLLPDVCDCVEGAVLRSAPLCRCPPGCWTFDCPLPKPVSA